MDKLVALKSLALSLSKILPEFFIDQNRFLPDLSCTFSQYLIACFLTAVYTYLGITYNHLSCFNEAKHNLYLKSLKGQFKLAKSFYPQPPNVKTSFHIFDHTI